MTVEISDVSLHGAWSPDLSDDDVAAMATRLRLAFEAAQFVDIDVVTVTRGRSPQGIEVPAKHLEVHFSLPA